METKSKQPLAKIAEIQIVYKNRCKVADRQVIRGSVDGYVIAKQSWDEDQLELKEQFKVILLNCANHVLGITHISTGSTVATIVDIRLLFATAIKANAVGLMLVHNHPSGNLIPSQLDRTLTAKILEVAKLLDMRVLDHLIISSEGYFSFADEGMM